MRSSVLMGTGPSITSARDDIRQHVVSGRMRSHMTVITVSITRTRLTFESHLVGDLKRLTQRKYYFSGLIL
jgi:hypothetical protein